jgi:hypothetical protein
MRFDEMKRRDQYSPTAGLTKGIVQPTWRLSPDTPAYSGPDTQCFVANGHASDEAEYGDVVAQYCSRSANCTSLGLLACKAITPN